LDNDGATTLQTSGEFLFSGRKRTDCNSNVQGITFKLDLKDILEREGDNRGEYLLDKTKKLKNKLNK
jgi:hypothetical protein